MPGSSAERLREADEEARGIAQPFDRLARRAPSRRVLTPAQRFAGKHHQAVDDQEQRGGRRRAEEPPHRMLEDDAEDPDRNRADDEQPADALVAVVAQCARARRCATSARTIAAHSRAIEDEQRERRPEMQHDDEGEKRRARAVDVAPCSNAGTRIVCPRLETGKSSLTPCNSARTSAWKKVTASGLPDAVRRPAVPRDELHAESIRARDRFAIVQRRRRSAPRAPSKRRRDRATSSRCSAPRWR